MLEKGTLTCTPLIDPTHGVVALEIPQPASGQPVE
jgi:hypothetical protein